MTQAGFAHLGAPTKDEQRTRAANRFLEDLMRDLERGEIQVEDLDGRARDRLEALLRTRPRPRCTRAQDTNRLLGKLVRDLENGDLYIEHLDAKVRDGLEALLRRRSR